MCTYSKAQYEYALKRIEELLPITPDAPADANAQTLELSIMSMVVEEYENEHCSIDRDLDLLKKGQYKLPIEEEEVAFFCAEP